MSATLRDETTGRGRASPDARRSLDGSDASLGELLGRVNSDVSTLIRKEIELAKVEITDEAKQAGKGGGMLGGAAFTGYMALVLLSFAAAWGIAVLIPIGWAFCAIGFLYASIAAALYLRGRQELKRVHGPRQTAETLREDAEWARAQMR